MMTTHSSDLQKIGAPEYMGRYPSEIQERFNAFINIAVTTGASPLFSSVMELIFIGKRTSITRCLTLPRYDSLYSIADQCRRYSQILSDVIEKHDSEQRYFADVSINFGGITIKFEDSTSDHLQRLGTLANGIDTYIFDLENYNLPLKASWFISEYEFPSITSLVFCGDTKALQGRIHELVIAAETIDQYLRSINWNPSPLHATYFDEE